MLNTTLTQFDAIVVECKEVFLKKMFDYGTAWRILRTSSVTDQIYIKASRIRSIQEKGQKKVDEGFQPEFAGIINYSVMGLIQLKLGSKEEPRMDPTQAEQLYDDAINEARSLLTDKNHDYSEAWRRMRVSSITDIILMKLLRIKQIEDNDGKTLISEGTAANYLDIINYSVFALILLAENTNPFEN